MLIVGDSLGIGAPLPEKAADGSWNRKELSSNDILRKQLLGRNYDKVMKAKQVEVQAQREKNAAAAAAAQANPGSTTTTTAVDDDDEEEGRAAMVGKRRKINYSSPRTGSGSNAAEKNGNAGANGDGEAQNTQSVAGKSASAPGRRKKATSYLDEILAQRAKKKKR